MATTPTINEATVTLDEHIQALPQELQAIILHTTVTAFTPGTTICIDRAYTPPPLLHITRATRALAASAYYTTHIFDCSTDGVSTDNVSAADDKALPRLIAWLRSLTPEHRALLRDVRAKNDSRPQRYSIYLFASDVQSGERRLVGKSARSVEQKLVAKGVGLGAKVVKVVEAEYEEDWDDMSVFTGVDYWHFY